MAYETLLVEIDGPVGIITLNRPEALNALSRKLCAEVADQLGSWNGDAAISCVIITGAGRAFAAGADIKEMAPQSYMDVYKAEYITRNWETIRRIRKPVIAAVAGYALGGGCELAMMCDFILAADTAKFGQPEIKLGVIPGSGGTQRLPRAVGKSKAMEMVLTGRMMDAVEAERAGLVSRIVAADRLLDDAMETATVIAGMSLPASMMAKESVNRAYESSLTEGVLFERRVFHSCFAMEDQKEGMAAFVEKRKAVFKHK